MAGSSVLLLLLFISISTVHSSDSTALRRVISDLGLHSHAEHPCQTSGVTCQSRGSILFTTRIRLPSRRLSGSMPASVGLLSELRELSLPNNRLSGAFPSEIANCVKLETLNLRNNRLSGGVPIEVSSLLRLRSLDLSSNRLSGDLNFLVHFPNLENLSLADNFFSGRIPLTLSSFRNLVSIDLSGNQNLHGDVPRLENSLRRSLLQNRYLTESGHNLTKSHGGGSIVAAPALSPLPSPHHQDKNKNKVRNWILGFIAGVLAGMVCGLSMTIFFRVSLNCIRGRYKNSGGPSIFSPIIKNVGDLSFLEKDDAISSLEIIGRGGCGEVYRAELPNNPGKLIAIKKINKTIDREPCEEESKQLNKAMKQMRAEIQTVGHIRHRNLLPLIAHVARADCSFLVYEFMNNGSLHDAIKRVSEGSTELGWNVRLNIAKGIAAGLEYLHIHHKPHIIHRDLKPANILLDDNMEARITDFGLAKELPDANTHITGSSLAGTFGYIAPEYHGTMKFTTKSDIYSFGVILAVLVTGKFPNDEFFEETDEMSVVKWLHNVMSSGDPTRAIDPRLLGNGHEEQMLLVLRIACFCTVTEPKDRPSSKDVRLMLAQIQI
ncbi:uncharacterized protein A4U43_C09F10780 [Asparagus officinalis]|uniref:Protein kinase domain-containing protein n=1 Tax=Asparagus officinalis TaxID=4686 RepID=A0A5P1E8H2_ASPOF|nr:leucine-rich repeat receptor-like serine/threonine/tyrosine-protein kinase SOBIR1 [Asparagus officinalis]ONK58303.1 uncharacterized protein A4U43_C09F10780 [Asparagus officinalis]